jgi:hypothetical protein
MRPPITSARRVGILSLPPSRSSGPFGLCQSWSKRNWPRPKPQPRTRPARGADRWVSAEELLYDSQRIGQRWYPTVVKIHRYISFHMILCGLLCTGPKILIAWPSWRLSHNPTIEAIAPSTVRDGAIVVCTAYCRRDARLGALGTRIALPPNCDESWMVCPLLEQQQTKVGPDP